MKYLLQLNERTNDFEVVSDFSRPDSLEEVGRFIAEIEIAKLDLIRLYDDMLRSAEEENLP